MREVATEKKGVISEEVILHSQLSDIAIRFYYDSSTSGLKVPFCPCGRYKMYLPLCLSGGENMMKCPPGSSPAIRLKWCHFAFLKTTHFRLYF